MSTTAREPWSIWTDEEVAAIQDSLKLIPWGSNKLPDAGSSYDCDSCPASFGFIPEGGLCPLCKGRLTGEITINFYPHHPDDDIPDATCDVCGKFANLSGTSGNWCTEHWPIG